MYDDILNRLSYLKDVEVCQVISLKSVLGSGLVSMRIQIQHFRPMRIRIQFQIQGFDDQKLEKKLQKTKI
jgi:hypothetical protein